jgi:hypothetical protein
MANPQVAQVKKPPLDSIPVSLQLGQAGVPSTQVGRIVVGIADIEVPAEPAFSPARRDYRFVSQKIDEESGMNQDENWNGNEEFRALYRFKKNCQNLFFPASDD